MKLLYLALVCAFLAVPGLCLGATPPDMNGTWTLDLSKSDFGGIPIPTDLTITIAANGSRLHVTQTGGGQPQIEMTLDTEGKEMVNEIPGGKMTSRHRWQGETLVAEVKLQLEDGTTLTMNDKISFSPDSKLQTVERLIKAPTGEARMVLVWAKQSK